MVKITGAERHKRRLKALTLPGAAEKITQALYLGAADIQIAAQISITTGATSGAQHKASAPGSPPKNDTGVLANNIETAVVGPLKAEVSSNAPYALIHEFGGTIKHPGGTPYFIGENGLAVFVRKGSLAGLRGLPVTKPHDITLPERPYMRPAVAKSRKGIRTRVTRVINRILRSV